MIDDLPWLASPWRHAAQALISQRLPQGLLIVGRHGLGRHRLALAIAAAILCVRRTDDGQACGACTSCRQVAAGTHPDLISVRVREDRKDILVEQIRELSRALSLTAGTQGRRCAIVHAAERLNRAAANALLKTLEEPRPGVLIILVTDRLAAMPVTVVSRCLQLPVTAPPGAQALAWLHHREQRADWPLLLALSTGAPLAAIELAENWPGDPKHDLARLCDAAAGRADPVALAADLKELSPSMFTQLLTWFAQTVMRLRFDATYPVPLETLVPLASQADARALSRLWRAARRLAVDPAALNAGLARERLILLLVEAICRNPSRGSR